MKKIIVFLIACIGILLVFPIFGSNYNAAITEWTNLIPSVPHTGTQALFTVKINSPYQNNKLYAIFRSSKETFSLPLADDGQDGDKKSGDGIFSCIFPTQKKHGLWYCLVAAGKDAKHLSYSLPQVFIVTSKQTEYRALWADSWNAGFLSRSQADGLVKCARDSNLNAIIVEVRKIGDAYYDSAYEPRASNLKDPGFDPLGYLCQIAHDTRGGKKRIEVHAWIVCYRIHKGNKQRGFPKAPHILGEHPEWASVSFAGKKFDNGSVYLDPGIPEVTNYNINVCLDIVNKYDVDGINFDYIRYPQMGWGYNPIALKRFQKLYNRSDKPKPRDPMWLEFQRNQVTHFLRKVYVNLIAVKPKIIVSVCTIGWGDIPGGDFKRTDAYAAGIQNWAEWNRQHILDVNFRMGYKRQNEDRYRRQFENWTRFTLEHQDFRLSPIGLGAYLNTFEGTMDQIRMAREFGSNGIVLYSYYSPCKDKISKQAFYTNLKSRKFPKWLDAPPLAWKISNPTGILAGTVYQNKLPADGAEITLPEINLKTKTDGTGFYAFMDVPPGHYRIDLNGKKAGASEVKANHISPCDIQYP